MTNEKDLSHSICHCQKPLQQKDLTAKMMDDRLFCQKQFLIEITKTTQLSNINKLYHPINIKLLYVCN